MVNGGITAVITIAITIIVTITILAIFLHNFVSLLINHNVFIHSAAMLAIGPREIT